MFLGRFYHTIDSKFRLTIPSQYREQLSDGLYLTEGLDTNLTAYSKPGFKRISEEAANLDPYDRRSRDLKRIVFSNAAEVNFDNNGRILIPSFLIEYAQLKSDVVIAGINDIFEIWSPENWALDTERRNRSQRNSDN